MRSAIGSRHALPPKPAPAAARFRSRAPGTRSTPRRVTSTCIILRGSRWCSRFSAGLPRPPAVDTYHVTSHGRAKSRPSTFLAHAAFRNTPHGYQAHENEESLQSEGTSRGKREESERQKDAIKEEG